MNEHDTPRNETRQPSATTGRTTRRRWLGYSLAGLAGMLGVTAITAIAEPDGWCRGGPERTHWGGKHRGGDFDPAMAGEFAGRKADRLLYELDATPEQRKKVQEILGQAFGDMGERHDLRQKDRQAFIDILSQPQIDRARLQALRDERIKEMGQRSERMMQAFADAAEVLTPEQRARLGEVIGERGFGPGRHRW